MPAATQPDPRTADIAARLSQPRLKPYLLAVGGNVKSALRLYHWNVEISGAVYESLHLFEVVLRNALDERLGPWNATQTGPSTGRQHSANWLLDPSHLLHRLAGDDIERATRRARNALRTGRRGGRIPGHADVLAQLSFSTWRFLLPDRDPGRQLLWHQALSAAFPHLAVPEQSLVQTVNDIYRLRNRVAHLEPLLKSRIVRDRFRDMRSVLAAIDPVVEQWFISRQRITATLKAKPAAHRPDQAPETRP